MDRRALRRVLETAGMRRSARYVVLHRADGFGPLHYCESIDLNDAFHLQTILAYGMNGADLPIGHVATIRLRVERQLGYKQAKFVMRIEAMPSLEGIQGGRDGFWEDPGHYEWCAGI